MPSAMMGIMKKAQSRIPEAAQQGAAALTPQTAASIMQQAQGSMFPLLGISPNAGGMMGGAMQQLQQKIAAQMPGGQPAGGGMSPIGQPISPQQQLQAQLGAQAPPAQGGMSPISGQGLTPEIAASIMQRMRAQQAPGQPWGSNPFSFLGR